MYNYRISIHCPSFPRCPHHWSQFPNTTTKLDGRCTEGNRKNPQNMGKIIQPNTIHATGIFTYMWLIFTVNVGKDTIHGWYGQQNSESTKVVIQIGNKFARFHIYSSFAEFRKKKKLRTLVDSNQVISGAVTGNLRTLGTSAWSPELKYSRIILEISFLEGIGFLLAKNQTTKILKNKRKHLDWVCLGKLLEPAIVLNMNV